MIPSQTNAMLGYPPDARLLILNADDFGFCHSINQAIIGALQYGIIRSTTLMMPCPWALHAVRFLSQNPQIPYGIHLTLISDPQDYRWGPVAGKTLVPSLIDEAGYFYTFDGMTTLLAKARKDEVEVEFRAQIEAALAAGLQPTHLDWHALRFGPRIDLIDLITKLAKDYGLALRVIGRHWIEKVQRQGLPCIDYDFLDSYSVDYESKAAHYTRLLRELPPGLSEWAIHPAIDTAEMVALEPTGIHQRQSDYDFWTSPKAREIIDKQGIILLDYRTLQPFWHGKA